MLPKLNPGTGYGSKERILLHRPAVTKQGNKPFTGPFMRQSRGQELAHGQIW